MNPTVAWLAGLSCVAPFTVDDARELYTTLKTSLGKQSIVDVHIAPNPDTVHVAIDSPAVRGRWTYVVKAA